MPGSPWTEEVPMKTGNVVAKTLTSILTLSQNVDRNGDVDVDSLLGLVRRPSGGLRIIIEESRPMVNVKVDEGLNVNGHVNLNDGHQGQDSGRRQLGDAPEAGPTPFLRHLLIDRPLRARPCRKSVSRGLR